MSREVLLNELSFLHKNLNLYLNHLPGAHLNWRPAEGMFTLFELACHLSATASMRAAILAGEPDEAIFGWDVPLRQGAVQDLRSMLDEGFGRVLAQFRSYSDEEFTSLLIRSPWSPPVSPDRHALELITHIHHHRGQLHNYLRQLGVGVSTDTLYSA